MQLSPQMKKLKIEEEMRHELFKVFYVSWKKRYGHRLRCMVFVGHGDGIGRMGLGVSVSKSEKDAIEKAKENAGLFRFSPPPPNGLFPPPPADYPPPPVEAVAAPTSVHVFIH